MSRTATSWQRSFAPCGWPKLKSAESWVLLTPMWTAAAAAQQLHSQQRGVYGGDGSGDDSGDSGGGGGSGDADETAVGAGHVAVEIMGMPHGQHRQAAFRAATTKLRHMLLPPSFHSQRSSATGDAQHNTSSLALDGVGDGSDGAGGSATPGRVPLRLVQPQLEEQWRQAGGEGTAAAIVQVCEVGTLLLHALTAAPRECPLEVMLCLR